MRAASACNSDITDSKKLRVRRLARSWASSDLSEAIRKDSLTASAKARAASFICRACWLSMTCLYSPLPRLLMTMGILTCAETSRSLVIQRAKGTIGACTRCDGGNDRPGGSGLYCPVCSVV